MAFDISAQKQPAFLKDYNEKWVDSVFNSMTTDQKIGQLLMPRGNYSGKAHDTTQLLKWISDYKIGGLVFFAGNPTRQVEITNLLQSKSDIPLFIGQDFEWGAAMRLDSTVRFPYAMSLGAIQGEESLLKVMGMSIGKHCKRLGVHINYAPVVDINNNPKNPVINFRSFGEDRWRVYQKAKAIWQGMEEQKIIATAKHFPGHGDTQVDSHYDLPVIDKSLDLLTKNELFPFQKLIDDGLPGVMTAHIQVPALDDAAYMPSTLSRKTITNLLRKKMGFQGLVFTDAMDMSGIVKYYSQGEAIVMALIAGNDIIETFMDVPVAVTAIKKAMSEGRLTNEWLDNRVKKILKAKSWAGLDKYAPVSTFNLTQDLMDIESAWYHDVMATKSITLITNKNNLLPVTDFSKKLALVSIGLTGENHLQPMLQQYSKVDEYKIQVDNTDSLYIDSLKNVLSTYDVIIVGYFSKQIRPAQKYGLTDKQKWMIETLGNLPNNVLLWMANVYGLNQVNFDGYTSVMCGYQDSEFVQRALGQAVFGANDVNGTLPVSLNTNHKAGSGEVIEKRKIPRFTRDYEHVEAYKQLHQKVDSMMYEGLFGSYFPGAVIQVIHKGQVLIQKAYGSKTFVSAGVENQKNIDTEQRLDVMDMSTSGGSVRKVESFNEKTSDLQTGDLYDIASVTKIAGTALAVMRWVDEGKLNLDVPFYTYFPEYKNYPMASNTFRDMLAHRAGLAAWIPFWKTTIDSTKTLEKILVSNPEWSDFYSKTEKKPFFLARWFGKKSKMVIDIQKSIQEKSPELWSRVYSSKNIVWKKDIYSVSKKDKYSICISENMWLREDYQDSIFNQILSAPVGEKGVYVYSDLHFYFYPELCKRLTGKPFDLYLEELYQSLGLHSLVFNPLQKFSKEDIVPTEKDSVYRHQMIHGSVHDEGAIMLGGISGHAGLFGNVNDLSKLMYMYLSNGEYNGKQVISENVVKSFTSYQFLSENNRRGLAFDKKDPTGKTNSAPSLSSPLSFGHSGFTGTYVWVDPQDDLVITFLSNRVHPDRKNNKINQNLFRQKLCDEVYKVVRNFKN
jgi:beta-glucosidase-like glycosyl hydrolase/CubicO group peptidase (beta-lactamase class C family)